MNKPKRIADEPDLVLRELWAAKDAIARESNYDMDQLFKRLRKNQENTRAERPIVVAN